MQLKFKCHAVVVIVCVRGVQNRCQDFKFTRFDLYLLNIKDL